MKKFKAKLGRLRLVWLMTVNALMLHVFRYIISQIREHFWGNPNLHFSNFNLEVLSLVPEWLRPHNSSHSTSAFLWEPHRWSWIWHQGWQMQRRGVWGCRTGVGLAWGWPGRIWSYWRAAGGHSALRRSHPYAPPPPALAGSGEMSSSQSKVLGDIMISPG